MLEQRVAGATTTAPPRTPWPAELRVVAFVDRFNAALVRSWADPMVRRGTIGMGLVAAGSISPAFLPGDTFDTPASPLIERFGLEWLGTGLGRVVTTVLLAVGMLLLVDAWLRMRPVHGRKAPSMAWLLWSLPIMLAPPLFSRDAYSYAAQGQIVLRGMDPYAVGPFWVAGPFADQVDPMWVQTPAPYGPLALQVQHAIVGLFPENAYVSAVAMRVPALLAVGLLAYALPRLAERYGVSGRHALWLGVLNPLVMMHFIGGAHGDAVMVALVTLALLLASRGQLVVATMTLAAATAYKQTAILALIGVVGMALQAQTDLAPGAAARLKALMRHGLAYGSVLGATFVAITTLTGLGWGWVGNLSVPVSLRSLLSPPTFVGSAVEWLMRVGGMPESATDVPVPLAQTIGLVAGLAGIAWITWRVAPRNPVLATAGAMLVLCASGPVLHPWYLLWGGLLLAAVRLSAAQLRTIVVVTLFFVTYGVVDATVSNGTWALGVSAAMWMIARLRAHRRRAHEQANEPVLVAALPRR
ncbi:polyprenol phosphomannose-dependent alpha 1,6 mannosyltransferase MptB [Terrabacter sp. GCM10028922]|uniref:polyprenol phosphomannose-dependent alpha 1,6 mannosyltransferase MptB n=1 Tax=Terrabacter sp. GCM10028922 TaxID=3273428 RepID=UPI00360FBB5C